MGHRGKIGFVFIFETILNLNRLKKVKIKKNKKVRKACVSIRKLCVSIRKLCVRMRMHMHTHVRTQKYVCVRKRYNRIEPPIT